MITRHREKSGGSIRCPRCGYDQRGVIETWRESCPLNGVCTECGLEFEWRELLRPELRTPRWCVEQQRSTVAFPVQVIATMMRAWRPWRMWRELRMMHELRPRRLTAYIIALIVVMVVTVCITNGIEVWAEWNAMRQWTVAVGAGTGGAGPPAAIVRLTPVESGWVVFLRGALMPLSNESSGSFTLAPGAAAAGVRGIPRLQPPRGRFEATAADLSLPGLFVASIPICTGLAFVALPISRRMAKVRWAHIVRVTAYSLGILIPLSVMTVLDYGLMQTDLPGRNAFATVVVLGWIAFVPMLLMYWSFAAGRYLRMSHPWAVGLSVVALGALTPISIAGVIWVLLD